MKDVKNNWIFENSAKKSNFNLNFREIYQYRDLLMLFIRRDIVSVYKQTILGPLWYFISPLLASYTQYWVFGRIAEFPSDGAPYFLFVLSGNILWSYFSASLTSISNTFNANQRIFGKVYFPRAIVPLSISASNLFQFAIKLVLLFVFIVTLKWYGKMNSYTLLLPILLIEMALISMGVGMIISSLTTKYRDFAQLMAVAVGLLMYITPVIYPTSMFLDKLPADKEWMIYANPLTGIFDVFRVGFLGVGNINWTAFGYSTIFACVIYLLGLVVFNKVEKSFMDTI
jgi:lipopolysaccharide transport system permease protein